VLAAGITNQLSASDYTTERHTLEKVREMRIPLAILTLAFLAGCDSKEEKQKSNEAIKAKSACDRWNAPQQVKDDLRKNYRIAKEVGQMPKDKVLSSAIDACRERTDNEADRKDCEACVIEIIDKLYK